jgi:hypothetical protein
MRLLKPLAALPRMSLSFLCTSLDLAHGLTDGRVRTMHGLLIASLPAVFLFRTTEEAVYNILWALVFGFATLNILSLGARHFESDRRGLTFGEILAIMVVVVSLILLGWEMLYVFHVFPIRLAPR